MKEQNEIWKELSDLGSPLANLPRHMPYAVPEAYFGQLNEEISQSVLYSQDEDPVLHYPKAVPFETPQGYFAVLPHRLAIAAIYHTDAARGASFGVPANYFEKLPQTLLKAVKDKEYSQNRSIPFRPAWKKKVLQWSAAALLLMGAGFGTYKYLHPSSPEAIAAGQLAKLDKEVIAQYIGQHVDEFDAEMLESSLGASADLDQSISTLREQEIRDYLEVSDSTDTHIMD